MMQDDELTYKVIGCAMRVHNELGNGFQERIYQRSLGIELEMATIEFKREVEQPIFYNNMLVGNRKADFVMAEKIIVELKALTCLENIHIIQAKNYLVAFNFPIGLLINFGAGFTSGIYERDLRAGFRSGMDRILGSPVPV